MTFKDAIHTASANIVLKLLAPDWAPGITERLRRVRLAFHELKVRATILLIAYTVINQDSTHYPSVICPKWSRPGGHLKRWINNSICLPAFWTPVKAMKPNLRNQNSLVFPIWPKLWSSQLNHNLRQYIYLPPSWTWGMSSVTLLRKGLCWCLVQTTAHTLCYTFAMLALHQDEQEILYQHIRSVHPDGRLPVRTSCHVHNSRLTTAKLLQTYKEMPLFTRSMAWVPSTNGVYLPINLNWG